MCRDKQFADLLKIDKSASEIHGKIGTAAVLTARLSDIHSIESAAEYALQHPEELQMLLKKELYFEWIAEAAIGITRISTEIDYKMVEIYDAASRPTKQIFENKVDSISELLTKSTSGIYSCINKLFEDNDKYNKYKYETIDCIKNIKLLTDDIARAIWRIRHPYCYYATKRHVLLYSIAAFGLAIPIWYFIGVHGQSVATLPDYAETLVASDVQKALEIARSQQISIWRKMIDLTQFLWNSLFVVPSIFLIPAAVLGVVQKRLSAKGKILRKYEKLFGDIGRAMQEFVPNPPKWVSVEVKMNGDINVAAGNKIQQNVKSTVHGSYNKVKGNYDNKTDLFLKEVADLVEKSGNANAADHYSAVVDNLKNDKKGMARTMWEGLVKILPAVGAVAGASSAIAKLFGESEAE